MARLHLVLMLALVPLAGCVDSDDSAEPVLETDALPAEDANAFFAARTEVMVRNVRPSFILMSNVHGANCIALDGIDRIVNGTLTATWDATTPASAQLEFRIDGADEVIVEGSSPLVLDVADLASSESRFMVMMQPTMPGAALDQDVTIDMELTYAGTEPDLDANWICSRF